MDQIVRKNAIVLGIIGAFLVSAGYIYMWQSNNLNSAPIGIVLWIIPLVLGVISQLNSKKKLSGYLSLKQAVLAFFLCVLVIFVIETVTLYLIYVVWDPETQEIMREINEARYEAAKAQSNRNVQLIEADYSIGNYVRGTATKLLAYTVFGIISGLFIKKNPPA